MGLPACVSLCLSVSMLVFICLPVCLSVCVSTRLSVHSCLFSRRAPQDSLRAVVVSDVTASIEQICHQRGLQCIVDRVHDAEAVQCSPGIVQGLVAAVEASEEVQLRPLTTALHIGYSGKLTLSVVVQSLVAAVEASE